MSYLIQDMLAELPVKELKAIKEYLDGLIIEKIEMQKENKKSINLRKD